MIHRQLIARCLKDSLVEKKNTSRKHRRQGYGGKCRIYSLISSFSGSSSCGASPRGSSSSPSFSICTTSPLPASHRAISLTRNTAILSPTNFNSCACSAVNGWPSSHSRCGLCSVGTPRFIVVVRPSFRSCGSSLCGSGSGGSEWCCITGPAGRMMVRVARLPARANSGCRKSANHSITSCGSVSVKSNPTWPFICCGNGYVSKTVSGCVRADVLLQGCEDLVGVPPLARCQGLWP
jgi:hypothetical protein